MNSSANQAQPINTITFDPELTPGARNAVNVCLRVQPSEKVTVITDEASREIAAAIVHELEIVGRALSSMGAWKRLPPDHSRTCPKRSAPTWKPARSVFSRSRRR